MWICDLDGDTMRFFYDLETYKNFFSAIFLDDKDVQHTFVISTETNQREELLAFLTQPDLELVGFNSISFDDVILKAIIANPHTPKQIYNLAQMIIGNGRAEYRWSPQSWQSIDLLSIIKSHVSRPSLKSCCIHLRHDRLEDLPYPFDAQLTPEQAVRVLEYNLNDVEITRKLYYAIEDAITLRRNLSDEYGVDLLSASESKIANVIYNEKYGKPAVEATNRSVISGSDLLPAKLNPLTPELKKIVADVKAMSLIPDDDGRYRFAMSVEFFGTSYRFGVGGIHSEDAPGIFETTDTSIIRDADVSSYYPAIIINEKLIPAHLDRTWLDLFARLRDERLEAKRAGDKAKADGLKIALNGTSGKLNSKYFWLYDPLQFFKMTLAGQLYLLDLIEKLAIVGIQTISANTDGIVCKFDSSLCGKYEEVCEEWQNRTGFDLEFSTYKKYVRLNVNSYLSISNSGKVKTKKDFYDSKPNNVWTFRRGFNAPIIAKALVAYFVDGIEPIEFITNHGDIHDFLVTQKAGRKFKLFLEELPGLFGGGSTQLQKTNRYYVANEGKVLVKRDSERAISILKGEYVVVLNDITDGQHDVRYGYYIDKVMDIIGKVENTPYVTFVPKTIVSQIEILKQPSPTQKEDIQFNVMINRKFINKDGAKHAYEFNTSFEPETHTIQSFSEDVLENGFAFTAMYDHTLSKENFSESALARNIVTPKHKENWKSSQILFVDDDKARASTVDDWLSDSLFSQSGTYFAESHNSNGDGVKGHAIWILPRPITEVSFYEDALKAMAFHFSKWADPTATDAVRTMFGSDIQPVHVVGNVLSIEDLKSVMKSYQEHCCQLRDDRNEREDVRNPLAYARKVLPNLLREFADTEKGSQPCRHFVLRKYWLTAAHLNAQDSKVGKYNKTLRKYLIVASKKNNYTRDYGSPLRLRLWVNGVVKNG